ncbi:MAG: hypothetical protein WD825_01485, partial [Gemmatimonadaceae bacterium]
MTSRTALLSLGLSVCSLPACDPLGAQDTTRRIAYRLPGMSEAIRRENITYRSLAGSADTVAYGQALQYDVYLPAGSDAALRPGVIFVHGGLVAGTRGVG